MKLSKSAPYKTDEALRRAAAQVERTIDRTARQVEQAGKSAAQAAPPPQARPAKGDVVEQQEQGHGPHADGEEDDDHRPDVPRRRSTESTNWQKRAKPSV